MMNLPVSQFYHVSVDNAEPYHVYGGLQDNSSWVGDSSYPGGVSNSRWENMYGGDGFWTWEDPSDSNYIYAEAQGGEIGRVNRHTHETRSIKPYADYGEKKLRFNWNTPIQMSPNEKGTIYIGAQFLFRSRDHGQSWDRISPDLTTNDPEKQKQEESGGVTVDNSSAEMHTTIYSISESPAQWPASSGWAPTTATCRSRATAARTWTNVTANVKGVGERALGQLGGGQPLRRGHRLRHLRSPHVRRHETVCLQDHRLRQDLDRSARAGRAAFAATPTSSRKTRVNPDLLFLGTEFGLWISIDGGQRWAQYKGSGFPSVAVRDLVVHPRTPTWCSPPTGAASGSSTTSRPGARSLIRCYAKTPASSPCPPPCSGWRPSAAGRKATPRSAVPAVPPRRSSLTTSARATSIGDLKIEILDAEGKLVDEVSTSKHRGVSRATWSMHLKPPRVPPAATAAFGAAVGPRVLPGDYTVRMTHGEKVYTTQTDSGTRPARPIHRGRPQGAVRPGHPHRRFARTT